MLSRRSIVITVILTALLTAVSEISAQEDPPNRDRPPDCSVMLRVEFLKIGKIGEVKRLSITCSETVPDERESYWQKSVAAAKEIKFDPL
ncbi:MAG TPA: hypothetical protein VMM38_13330 [Aridibacter sp.]|nr:hypothetical protein [Aridibacter sp.]